MTCLKSSSSVDDGLDEDAQVLARLSGLVALQTDAESSRPRVIYRNLVHQVLPAILGKDRTRLLSFLKRTTIVVIKVIHKDGEEDSLKIIHRISFLEPYNAPVK